MTIPSKSPNGNRGSNANGAALPKPKLKSVTRGNPCPVCGGHRRCSIGEDGLLLCRERQGEQPGFVHLGAAKADNGFHLYRRQDDPVVLQREEERKARQGNGRAVSGAIDWARLAADYQSALTPERRDELAAILGLPAAVLDKLSVGWSDSASCWTFPEVDADGGIIGIGQRRRDGSKNQVTGGRRGLIAPQDWKDRGGPLLLPEGASNALALTAMGLSAVGRPSNLAGVDHLARMLATFPADRKIIAVGDFDPKPDGKWPGLEGCKSIAAQLSQRLGRKVSWVLPPLGFKDVREWTNAQELPLDCADSWNEAGEQLLADLCARCKEADAETPTEQAEPPPPRFRFRTSVEFLGGDYSPQWMVRKLLVRGQPVVFGGPKKSLKTTLEVELTYSLAYGKPFLGRFDVGDPLRVGIMSGESGEYTLKETALRIAQAKGVDPRSENILWEFTLPRLAYPEDLDDLARAIRAANIQVLIVDPLYLCLLSGVGAAGLSASNLFQVGPLLLSVARTCLEADCTPILSHHFKITRPNPYDEPQLEDLAFAGIQEFARQWLLVGRRERYETGSGQHKLWMTVGGSMGQSGLWALDIDEGVIDEGFQGRGWDVYVQTATDVRTAEKTQAEERKSVERGRRDREDEDKFLAELDRLDPNRQGVTFNKVRDLAHLSGPKGNSVLYRLAAAGILIEIPDFEILIGSGAKRKVLGVKRVNDAN